jgi:hypothetical protein
MGCFYHVVPKFRTESNFVVRVKEHLIRSSPQAKPPTKEDMYAYQNEKFCFGGGAYRRCRHIEASVALNKQTSEGHAGQVASATALIFQRYHMYSIDQGMRQRCSGIVHEDLINEHMKRIHTCNIKNAITYICPSKPCIYQCARGESFPHAMVAFDGGRVGRDHNFRVAQQIEVVGAVALEPQSVQL